MKLAEGLMQRADLQRRAEQLKVRLVRSARVQEGEPPAEDLNELMVELERVSAQLVTLVQRINRTNMVTAFGENGTIADAIAQRDGLRLRQGVYNALAEASVARQDRYMRSEMRYVAAVNVAEVQKLADALARQYRGLDGRIQAANWLTEMVE